jgi:plastocyanin
MRLRSKLLVVLALTACAAGVCAETATVRGRVEVATAKAATGKAADEKAAGKRAASAPIPATVVWLTAAPGSDVQLAPPAIPQVNPRLTQKNKSFDPHLLVVPAGSTVEFPNRDPFFHNVFSLFEGKRFDLGLYEAGTTRKVASTAPASATFSATFIRR